jgi:hypothetical protein
MRLGREEKFRKTDEVRAEEFMTRVFSKLKRGVRLSRAEELIFNNSVYVREALAKQSQFLEELAEDWCARVRGAVAKNPDTPPEILYKLASDEDEGVRACICTNPNAPVELLVKLAEDRVWVVRMYVAQHPTTPVKILKKLAHDHEFGVRHSAEYQLNALMRSGQHSR